MTFYTPFRDFCCINIMRWALLGGAIFDIVFGTLIIFCWRRVLPFMGLDLPPTGIYVQLAGLLTVALALMILIAGIAPIRYHANITFAAIARLTNGALLFYFVCKALAGPQILGLVAAEIVLGVLHAIYSRRLAVAATSIG